MPFQLHDPDSESGIRFVAGVPYTAMPWAMRGGEVVYLDCATDRTAARKSTGHLPRYTPALSMERRRRCLSELGLIALRQPAFSQTAVTRVTLGVKDYIQYCQGNQKGSVDTMVAECTGKYMYSASGFGRLGQPAEKPDGPVELYRTAMQTLDSGALPSVLAIHDFMGRVVFAKLKGCDGQNAVFNRVGSQVRPSWVFGESPEPGATTPEAQERNKQKAKVAEELRGRQARPGPVLPTKARGLMPEGSAVDDEQERERGIDRWMPSSEKKPQATIDIEQRNLIFGAGPSGSTGTLLQAALLFGNLDTDLLREYVFAIVGYLVGGGMHSYHEVMVIARMAGCPYRDGACVPSLPDSFLDSPAFTNWRDRYWDIVVLGGKLWVLDKPEPAIGRIDHARIRAFEEAFEARGVRL